MSSTHVKKALLLLLAIFLAIGFSAASNAQEEKQDTASAYTTGKEELTAEQKAALEEAKKEAEQAKEEAQKLQSEAEKAKIEAELQKKEAELEKEKLEAEQKETKAIKKEAEVAKKTARSREELEAALEKARKEEEEDRIALEKARAAEEKMLAAQKKASLAEREMKLAQEKLSVLMSEVRQQDARQGFLANLGESLVIIFVGLIVFLVIKISIRRFAAILARKEVIVESETVQRLRTAMNLFSWLGTIVIVLAVVYMVLENHGFNMAPLIAGAGIVGIAFGFGGQYLIRDLINGLFILIEGQYSINDVVKIGDHGGLVEDINLRITRLRDLEGRVIFIPNGEIKTVINYTKNYAQALLDIGVAYKENVDQVMDIIREVGKGMREDQYFGRLILSDLEMLGVDAFADSAVIIKFRMKTLPIKQWEVMREFRRRLKNRFDELGIEIPFPHTTLYWGTGKDNQWVKDLAERASPPGQG